MAYIRKYREKWRVEIELKGFRTSRVFDNRRDAQEWADKNEQKIKRMGAYSTKTFGEAVNKYLESVSVKKTSHQWEQRRLAALLAYFGSDTGLHEIDAPQIAEWRDERLKTVTPSTVIRCVNLLRHVFSVARNEWRWIEHDPFKGVKMPKQNAPRHQVWTWKLIKRVLRAPRIGKTKEMQAAFHIALRTGMRLGEVLSAPENYDPSRSVVIIKTKTEARAEIPIGRIAQKLLNRPPFVVKPNEGSVLFSKLCRELLIENLTFHDARATALTLLSKKVDVLTLAKISRHRNLSLLSNVYYRERASDIAKRI